MNEELSQSDVATLEYLTLRECATMLRTSIEYVRQRCVLGELRSANYGTEKRKTRRVRREWLEEFARKREAAPEAPQAVSEPRNDPNWTLRPKATSAAGRAQSPKASAL